MPVARPSTTRPPAPRRAGPPARRDLYVDLVRAVAIVAVAVGHWLVVVPGYRAGRFDGVNALGTVPIMRDLTWLFQVMPLFFVVGGYANAVSWRSARRRDEPYATWVRTRLVRLVRPTAVLVVVWGALAVGLRAAGVDPDLVHTLAWLVVVPVWFLAVYVVVVALAPAMLAAHVRWGFRVLVVLTVAATVVDGARIGLRVDGVAYANFFFVFLFAQQLGFAWLDGRLDRARWQPWCLFVGGVASLWVLTHVGPYPVSLVGVPGEAVANNAPPTITLVALGVAQAGLALLVRAPATRWLRRRRVQLAVLLVNARAMTILLWHFTALVLVALVVLPTGIVPDPPSGSGAWWLVRLAAVALDAVVLVALVSVVGRVERPRSGPAAPADTRRVTCAPGRVVVATALLAASFSVITVGGLSAPDGPLGLPVVGLGLFGAGAALLRPRAARGAGGRVARRPSVVEGEDLLEELGLLDVVHPLGAGGGAA